MKSKDKDSTKSDTLKIVVPYTIISVIYISMSDYFLDMYVTDFDLHTKLQTYKGFGFIIVTATLLYLLLKKNNDTLTSYFKQIIDVTNASNVELKKAQEEYLSLFNYSPVPIWLFDMTTLQFIHVNEAACDIYGYTLEEYKTMKVHDIRPKEDIPNMKEFYTLSSPEKDYTLSSTIRHLKKNGDIIIVKLKTSFVYYKGKKVRIATVVDVTAEIEIQNQLKEINTKLQLANEIASMGYWTNDLVKNEIKWSEEMYKIYEQDPSTFELTIENIRSLLLPEDQTDFGPQTFSINGNSIKETERKIITASGKVKWILGRIHIVKDANDNPIRIDGITQDISTLKVYEQELSESHERFKILTKATVEAIIDWDIKNNTVLWGEGFHTLLGYDLTTSQNDLWSKNIHPDDRSKVLHDLNQTLEDPTQHNFNAEFRFIKANGDVAIMQHRGVLIRDTNGKAIRAIGAMIDLTDTLERIRKIEIQNKALREISWLQSHIVRAPLANLLGLITLLKDSQEKGIYDSNLIDYIYESTEKLDQVIHDIVEKSNETDIK
jgi:PAS domain S-box-containing protein